MVVMAQDEIPLWGDLEVTIIPDKDSNLMFTMSVYTTLYGYCVCIFVVPELI